MQNSPQKPVACATLLTSENYLDGALVLGYSLQQHGWSEETLALVTPNISAAAREKLAGYWSKVVEVQNVENPHPPDSYGFASYGSLFTKLRIWEMEEYSRLIYIDSDTVVLGNIDDLKNAPAFAAAPCMWTPDTFNAGVMVIEPSREIFADMISKIGSTPSHDGSDQGFLNNYFNDWFTGPPERRLPAIYNLQQFIFIYAVAWNHFLPNLKILHYTGPKPWRLRTRLGLKLMRIWFTVFTKAPRTGPTPFSIWRDMRDAQRASQATASQKTATQKTASQNALEA